MLEKDLEKLKTTSGNMDNSIGSKRKKNRGQRSDRLPTQGTEYMRTQTFNVEAQEKTFLDQRNIEVNIEKTAPY